VRGKPLWAYPFSMVTRALNDVVGIHKHKQAIATAISLVDSYSASVRRRFAGGGILLTTTLGFRPLPERVRSFPAAPLPLGDSPSFSRTGGLGPTVLWWEVRAARCHAKRRTLLGTSPTH
jgi:hypothetical protein